MVRRRTLALNEMSHEKLPMNKPPANSSPASEAQIRARTLGELQPFAEKVLIGYDPAWPDRLQL